MKSGFINSILNETSSNSEKIIKYTDIVLGITVSRVLDIKELKKTVVKTDI